MRDNVEGRPRPALRVRTIFVAAMAALGLYVVAIGGYVIMELAPSAATFRARTTEMGAEYDSIGARSRLLRNAVVAVQRLSIESTLTPTDRQHALALRSDLGRVAEQAAGVHANMLLYVPPAMRVALAEAAGAESNLAGSLMVALDYLDRGDPQLAREEVGRARDARELMIDRLDSAQRLGLASLAEGERKLGVRAHRVTAAIEIWVLLGVVVVGLLILGARRRVYLPMAALDARLALVAQGDLQATLPVTRNDEFGRLAATFNQMTEVLRTRTEVEALRQSEARFRALIEQAPVPIFVSRDGVGLYANRAWMMLFGVSQPEELVGRSLLDFYAPQSREERLERSRRFNAGLLPVPDEFESVGLRTDGTQFFMHVSNSTTTLPDGPAILSFCSDVTARKEAEARTQSLLMDKEALLKEVQHRVKNNLQLIASLLRLEIARSAQAETKAALHGIHGRIRSIARLHEALTHTDHHASLDLGAYLKGLTNEIAGALLTSPSRVKIRQDLTSVRVEMDQAMHCGLLANELLTNALKHGFPDERTGEVLIELHPLDEGRQLRLRVSDTGAGMSPDVAIQWGHSLGSQLVSDLVTQLGGTLELGPGRTAMFTVIFPVKEVA